MISANDLKVKGVKAIQEKLKDASEVAISVRGKIKYITMTVEQYDILRAAEIDSAYHKALKDVEAGDYIEENAEEHILRLWKDNETEESA